jgi:DNA-binding IclR family transcriptional regulator
LAEVAAVLEVSRPTAFRLLVALETRGYVEHARREHVYRLGQAIHVLAARAAPESLLRLAEPALSDLRARSGETANLALVNRTTIVYAAILDGIHTLRMSVKVGETVPAHATALGKAILSQLPPASVGAFVGQEPYRQYTANTILDRARLDSELTLVRDRGYAVDDEECDTGASCVAGIIVGHDGFPVGGISVSGLAARMPETTQLDLGETVRSWCEQISKQVGDTRSTRGGFEEK